MSASAILLAAGRGTRMRPLTDHTPKPLLAVQGKPLMQWPMEALLAGGFQHLVVNTAWLGEQIPAPQGYGHLLGIVPRGHGLQGPQISQQIGVSGEPAAAGAGGHAHARRGRCSSHLGYDAGKRLLDFRADCRAECAGSKELGLC